MSKMIALMEPKGLFGETSITGIVSEVGFVHGSPRIYRKEKSVTMSDDPRDRVTSMGRTF